MLKVLACEPIEDRPFCNGAVIRHHRDPDDAFGGVIVDEMYGSLRARDYREEIVFKIDAICQAFACLNDPDGVIQGMPSDRKCLDALHAILCRKNGMIDGQVIYLSVGRKPINVGIEGPGVIPCMLGIRPGIDPMFVLILIYVGKEAHGAARLCIPGIYSEEAVAGGGDGQASIFQLCECCMDRIRICAGVMKQSFLEHFVGILKRVVLARCDAVPAPMFYLIKFLQEVIFKGSQSLAKTGDGEEYKSGE